MALHRTVAGAHRGNLEDERRPHPSPQRSATGGATTARHTAMRCSTSKRAIRSKRPSRECRPPSWSAGSARRAPRSSAKRGCATVRGSRRWPRSSSPERPHGPWRGIAANSAAARNNSPNSSPWWKSHDSLTSRLDATDAREAAVKELLEGRVAAVRDIAATCYTYGEGERLSAKMREADAPAMLADVVRMADIYNDRAVTRLREAFPVDRAQLRLRGARHRHRPRRSGDARHDAQIPSRHNSRTCRRPRTLRNVP